MNYKKCGVLKVVNTQYSNSTKAPVKNEIVYCIMRKTNTKELIMICKNQDHAEEIIVQLQKHHGEGFFVESRILF